VLSADLPCMDGLLSRAPRGSSGDRGPEAVATLLRPVEVATGILRGLRVHGHVSTASGDGTMSRTTDVDEARRALLIRMLAAGSFAIPGISLLAGCAAPFGRRPERLPADKSVWRAEGGFSVNGAAADETVLIRPGDTVETDATGGLIFAVGETGFFARPSTRVRLETEPGAGAGARVGTIRLEEGGLLTVFARRAYRLETPLAVIGIRGTGLYAQIEADQDYVCTCYGSVDISARADPASTESIVSAHHDAPRFVTASGARGSRVKAAPFKDHTDEELLLIETLVGRTPPFPVPGDAYGMPRRRSY
jgi:hypothetical protein